MRELRVGFKKIVPKQNILGLSIFVFKNQKKYFSLTHKELI